MRHCLLLSLLLASVASANVKLPRLFGDNMVLQRNVPLPIWGTAGPNEAVTVKLASQTVQAVAAADGNWSVKLQPLTAGGPYSMTVAGANTLTVNNIMVGEVWLASGQSNMAFALSSAMNAPAEIAAANYPRLRMITVSQVTSDTPKTDLGGGSWQICTPATAGNFSAVAYFFARKLMQELDVPVGVINSSVSGTPAESWVSKDAMATDPGLKDFSTQQLDDFANLTRAEQRYAVNMKVWESQTMMRDPGDLGLGASWARPSLDTRTWKPFWLPSYSYVSDLCSGGVIWFRKDVDIPSTMAGRNLTLALGTFAEHDWVYFDGTQIGAGGTMPPLYSSTSRSYTVPAAIATLGKHVITIRAFVHTRLGGQLGSAGSTNLTGNGVTLNLQSWWQSKIELQLGRQTPAMESTLPKVPVAAAANVSTMLYNGMIAPLIPYAIQGAIWYQGEQNWNRGMQYRTLFPTLINDWRKRWGRDFPFYFVQLASYMGTETQPTEADWAELREAQTLTAKNVTKTGMATIIDIGMADNIHPTDKQNVGARLAAIALAKDYGYTQEYSGPVMEQATVEGGAIRVRFSHTTGGLTTSDSKAPGYFAIAGEDRQFRWAQAAIDGDTVVVRSPQVPNPLAVRYAWANNPEGANLKNGAGFPASPFRTDEWPRALPALCQSR